MAQQTPKKVIPAEFIPDVETRTVNIDGKDYLIANDAMFTFYQRSKGELSPFFLALRDEKKLLGCRCTKCGIVRVPPFLQRCPDCEFAPTELVEVEDAGKMLSTPAITYFATSMFLHMAPFGRGRFIPNGADTAMSVNIYTTTGILVPGLVKKGTEMKVIFRDERIGEITDIFCIPAAELTPEQIRKKGLQESELNWGGGTEPELPEATDKDVAASQDALKEMQTIAEEMSKTPRARQAIADWKRNIAVKTTGGEFSIEIDNGDLRIVDRVTKSPDLVIVCEDPNVLADGLGYRGSLTEAIIQKKLWINKNLEFTTIFKLERMARFLVLSKKEQARNI